MNDSTLTTWKGLRGKKYLLTLAVVYLAYLTHGIQAIVISQNSANLQIQWNVDSAGISSVISYTGLAKFITVWICGEISDKIGRKKMAAIGAIMYTVCFIGLMTTKSYAVACVMAFMAGAATSFFDGSLYAAAQESWIAAPGSAVILIKGFISVSGTIYPLLVAGLRSAGGSLWMVGMILPAVMSVILLIISLIAPYSYDEEMKARKKAGAATSFFDGSLYAAAQESWIAAPGSAVILIKGFISVSGIFYPLLAAGLRSAGGSLWMVGMILPAVMSVILLIITLIAPYSYDEEMKARKKAGARSRASWMPTPNWPQTASRSPLPSG